MRGSTVCWTAMLVSFLGGPVAVAAQDIAPDATVSCPIAPVASGDSLRGPLFLACQVEQRAVPVDTILPQYPDIFRAARVEGTARVQFVVAPDGRVEEESFRAITSTHALFEAAARGRLARTEWIPAVRQNHAVRQLVDIEFLFRLRPSTEPACPPVTLEPAQVLVCAVRTPTRRCSSHRGCEDIP